MNSKALIRRMTFCATLGAVVIAANGCEVGAEYPEGDFGYYPSDAFIATTEPFYYEGRATYWYGGRWYYRNGAGWGHYGREPNALYQRRAQGAPRQRAYESGGRSGVRSGHGGGRSGGAHR
jgi:hypothetical protein